MEKTEFDVYEKIINDYVSNMPMNCFYIFDTEKYSVNKFQLIMKQLDNPMN